MTKREITDIMVDAAAKAIVNAAFSEEDAPPWEDYRPHARAALEAADSVNGEIR